MDNISEIVKEIERHKGVILPEPAELGKFTYEQFTTACDTLHIPYEGKVQEYVESRYRMVLAHTMEMYEEHPNVREFYYMVDWDALPEAVSNLVQRIKRTQDGK